MRERIKAALLLFFSTKKKCCTLLQKDALFLSYLKVIENMLIDLIIG